MVLKPVPAGVVAAGATSSVVDVVFATALPLDNFFVVVAGFFFTVVPVLTDVVVLLAEVFFFVTVWALLGPAPKDATAAKSVAAARATPTLGRAVEDGRNWRSNQGKFIRVTIPDDRTTKGSGDRLMPRQ